MSPTEAAPGDLLGRVVRGISRPGPAVSQSAGGSILAQAAASYAKRPVEAEATIPTGFDPRAASLFEAVVEAAFLIANADGEFDEAERQTFETVVAEACRNTVTNELHALVSDLRDQLAEDGFEDRIAAIGKAIRLPAHKDEVLRIAALMAHISGGVSQSERDVLDMLARGLEMPVEAVDRALALAVNALASEE
ncbi:MAG: tellurite resistance TerB family protein [Polyangiaceae bacterium]|nr:tellurite resistance TerB family protein [Polyangiaceae bacterium]